MPVTRSQTRGGPRRTYAKRSQAWKNKINAMLLYHECILKDKEAAACHLENLYRPVQLYAIKERIIRYNYLPRIVDGMIDKFATVAQIEQFFVQLQRVVRQ